MKRKLVITVLDFFLFCLAGVLFQIIAMPLITGVGFYRLFNLGIGSTRKEFDERRKFLRSAKGL